MNKNMDGNPINMVNKSRTDYRGGMILHKLCLNISQREGDGWTEGPSDVMTTMDPSTGLQDRDRHAILYIVVVLLFYSIGIIIGIITYLKREKEEIEEDKRYEDFMNFRNDPDKWARYFRVQRMVSHLNWVEQEQDRRKLKEKQLQSQISDDSRKSEQTTTDGTLSPVSAGTEIGRSSFKKGKKSGLRLSLSPKRSRNDLDDFQQVQVVIEQWGEKTWHPKRQEREGKARNKGAGGGEGIGAGGKMQPEVSSAQIVTCKDDIDLLDSRLGSKKNITRMTSL